MSIHDFYPIWRKSEFYRYSGEGKFYQKLRFIMDFMLCDKKQAAAYIIVLDGDVIGRSAV